MFFGRKKVPAFSKIAFLFLTVFLRPVVASAVEFPERLSDAASISVLFVDYSDFSHSLFSKSCLRIYDRESGFDQIVDFAHFENFDDELFLLKFFLRGKKAKIRTAPFLEFFLALSKKPTVSLTETLLALDSNEVAYIYSFVRTMRAALPDYEYDFDILTNNSETHISRILHDSARMAEKEASERYPILNVQRHSLQYKLVDGHYILTSEKEIFEFQRSELEEIFHEEWPVLIIILGVFAGLIFLITCYQTVVYFFERLYFPSVFRTVQILDFLILFIAGLCGSVILFQDIFSNQSLFRNNFQFLFLFPLHTIAAFTFFKPIAHKKIEIIYWSIVSALPVIYFSVYSILRQQLPIVSFLLALPLFLRTLYFAFLVWRVFKK